jgi:hypothetical protein
VLLLRSRARVLMVDMNGTPVSRSYDADLLRLAKSSVPAIPYTRLWSLAWRYLTQFPQGLTAARVSELFRVRGGPLRILAAVASAVEPKSLYASRRPGTHLAAFS